MNRNDAAREAVELLYIDQHIFNERKMRRKKLTKTWTDHKTAYSIVPKAGYYTVLKCLK